MIHIARVLECQECHQDDDLEALAVFDIEPNRIKAMSANASDMKQGQDKDVPIKVIIQDLDRRRPNPTRRFFCHRDKHGRVRLSNDEAFFAFPFEFVSAMGKE